MSIIAEEFEENKTNFEIGQLIRIGQGKIGPVEITRVGRSELGFRFRDEKLYPALQAFCHPPKPGDQYYVGCIAKSMATLTEPPKKESMTITELIKERSPEPVIEALQPEPKGNPEFAYDHAKGNFEIAKRYLAAGINVMPIDWWGTKKPILPTWKSRQETMSTLAELSCWFTRDLGHAPYGIGLLCGSISGNLEILDFDDPGMFAPWRGLVEDSHPGLVDRLTIHLTPTNGRHCLYRCETIQGNQKLAQDVPRIVDGAKETPTLIETRGVGGQCLAPGSPHHCHKLNKPYLVIQGTPETIPTVTPEERQGMLDAARALTRYVPDKALPAPKAKPSLDQGGWESDTTLPHIDFNLRGDWEDILAPHGWTLQSGSWDSGNITRPGKHHAEGASATINRCGADRLKVFSSSAEPFEVDRSYSKSQAHAYLNHNGDFRKMNEDLLSKGYGESQYNLEKYQAWLNQFGTEPAIETVQEPVEQVPAPATPEIAVMDVGAAGDEPLHKDHPLVAKRPVLLSFSEAWKKAENQINDPFIDDLAQFGRLHILSGEPGSGKSVLLDELVCCVATGEAFLGLETAYAHSIFIDAENVLKDKLTQLKRMISDEGSLFDGCVSFVDQDSCPNPLDAEFVRACIDMAQEKHGAKTRIAVFIDTLRSLYGSAEDYDENKPETWTRILNPLKAMAVESGAAIFVLHHNGWSGRISGSTALRSVPDYCLEYSRSLRSDTGRLSRIRGRGTMGVFEPLVCRMDDHTGRLRRIFNRSELEINTAALDEIADMQFLYDLLPEREDSAIFANAMPDRVKERNLQIANKRVIGEKRIRDLMLLLPEKYGAFSKKDGKSVVYWR